jgi:GNAT superfamily N-acetyltransferase
MNTKPMKNISHIIIRQGQSEDIAGLHRLIVQLAVYERSPKAVTATIDDYLKAYEEKVFGFKVADLDGQIVGACLYYIAFSTWKGKMLHLEDFIVDEDYRRKGIGGMLFEAFIQEAKDLNCKLTKWQVLDWNKPAQSFYEKYKATIQRDWWNGLIYFES